MALTEMQIYTGLVYRKCVYDLITSDSFKRCFNDLKKITRSVLIEKMGKGSCIRTFETLNSESDYFDKLEEALEFDESTWINNVHVLNEFFIEVLRSSEGFKMIRLNVRDLIQSLRENGMFNGTIRIPKIPLSPDTYSKDNVDAKTNYVASSVPNTKYHPGAASPFPPNPLDPSKYYPINHTGKRGVCLLVNIYRKNSQFDVPPAKQIFEQLNYVVRVFDNVAKHEFIDSLGRIREEIELHNSDSFILIFSSHGDLDNVNFPGELKMSRTDIIRLFTGDYCPVLRDKPKIFFFQNCRGAETHIEDTTRLEPLMADAECSDDVSHQSDRNKQNTAIPADVLRLYATAEGKVAYRDDKGSIFLRCLYEILSDPQLRRLPICQLETVLRNRVYTQSKADLSADNKIGGQLPESTTSLTKDFYFCLPDM